jgi:transposase
MRFISGRHIANHEGASIGLAIKPAGATLLYLPPYGPDFNPIENAFAKLRRFFAKRPGA